MRSCFHCIAVILFTLATPVAGAATVYKWVDESGRVSFSDQPPPTSVPVEVLSMNFSPPPEDAVLAARLDRMRETTERMAADRREREAARSEERRLREQARLAAAPTQFVYYPRYGRRRPLWPDLLPPGHRPGYKLPPLGVPAIPVAYPEKYIRQRYRGAAGRIFNPGRGYQHHATGHGGRSHPAPRVAGASSSGSFRSSAGGRR